MSAVRRSCSKVYFADTRFVAQLQERRTGSGQDATHAAWALQPRKTGPGNGTGVEYGPNGGYESAGIDIDREGRPSTNDQTRENEDGSLPV